MGLQCNDEMQEDVMSETDIIEAKEQVSSVIFEHQEQEIPHNPYDQELREMDSIRRGDVEMLKHSMSETYRGEIGQLARNPVRQAKNVAICVITLASRAAIDGGMVPEEAFSMVDGYILKIEDMNNAVKINSMMRQAEYELDVYKRQASDRATMLNLMVGLNGYTLCSGIICEELNGSDYLAIPFEGDEQNQNSDMEIGYITRKNSILSKVGNLYVSSLKKYLEQNTSFS